MATLEAVISLQMSRAAFIEGIFKESNEEDIKQLADEKLRETLMRVSQKIENLTSLDYFKHQVFDSALTNFAAAKVALLQLLEKKGAPNLNQLVRVPGEGQLTSSTRRALPEISLPKFSGIYQEWRPWRDLFQSLVGNNQDIPGVERMHYLRLCLSGEPLKLISNLPVSEESFRIAWRTLIDRYENKRLLVAAHLDQLLNPAPMKSHSASDLNLLTSSISEALSALKALDQPTDYWGPVVVHVLTRRLSNKLREAWENKIGASTEYPSLDHLLDFLQGRSRAMETLEVGSQSLSSASSSRPSQPTVQTRSVTKISAKVNQMSASRPSQQSAQQLHGPSKKIQSTQSTSWADAGYPCSYCKRDHYIASCSEFKALSPIARKEVVDRLYLCYNCLGKHSIRVCQTSRTCRTCQEKHHTLLHLDRSRRPAPTRPTPQNCSAQPHPQQSARPAQSSGVPSVSYNSAGEVIQSSELSLISESLVRQLKLKKQRSSIHISGVGKSSFGTTSGEVHLTLQSIYSAERIEVIAHSLDHLTASLPTFSAEDLEWDHLNDLNLADPNFRIPAPNDLLIGADVFGRIIKPSIIKQGADAPVAQLTSFGWIVFGPTGTALAPTRLAHHLAVSEVSNDQLEDLLSKFWIQEEVPGRVDSDLSADELSCEQHFRQTHSRDSTGRYVVRLPFSSPVSLLGNSYRPALACLHRMIARISKDQRFFQLYSDFLKEYVDLDHM
ncbi:uncharacterized protein, partial [Fopius arisanus]|uniref:Peptidase aspartic putative domain-containing protein n=1 Tax=Fopius arisanus TaxID=64838 RepID=A0A9R1TQF0_9HYME